MDYRADHTFFGGRFTRGAWVVVDVLCPLVAIFFIIDLFLSLVLARYIPELAAIRPHADSWVGLAAYFLATIIFIIFPMRNKLARICISSAGIEANLQDITKKQVETENLQKEMLKTQQSLREIAVDSLEMYNRLASSSGRWAGWTEREQSKVYDGVNKRAASLDLTPTEWQKILGPRKRWELIDESSKIFEDLIRKAYPEAPLQGNTDIAIIREEFNRQWKENDVVSSRYLEELLGQQTKISSADKERIQKLINTYHNFLKDTIFAQKAFE